MMRLLHCCVHPAKIVVARDRAEFIKFFGLLTDRRGSEKKAQNNCTQTCHMSYQTQSAINTFVSPGFLAPRFDAKTSFFPSGENIGNPSNVSLNVTRSMPVPSRLIRARSKFG